MYEGKYNNSLDTQMNFGLANTIIEFLINQDSKNCRKYCSARK